MNSINKTPLITFTTILIGIGCSYVLASGSFVTDEKVEQIKKNTYEQMYRMFEDNFVSYDLLTNMKEEYSSVIYEKGYRKGFDFNTVITACEDLFTSNDWK